MRVFDSHFLADKKRFNRGQAATLIEIEAPSDYDALAENIAKTGYYDGAYFASHSNYVPGKRVAHFMYVAEMAAALHPRSALEVGCGRGDVLSLLARRGVDVTGVDLSEAAVAQAWPELAGRVHLGDLAKVCQALSGEGRRFDLILGFDVWEHLHPKALDAAIASAVSCASDDALFLFVVPAFGVDAVFGECFPLELEENRPAYDARVPFRYLLAEHTSPPIPASGHLVWAHTVWWEQTFAAHGLERVPELERQFHRAFDLVLPYPVRSFYVFRKSHRAALERVEHLVRFGVRDALRSHARFVKAKYLDRELAGPWLTTRLREAMPQELRQALKHTRDRLQRLLERRAHAP